jgi:bifunctional non-homologous end joining protein LigD
MLEYLIKNSNGFKATQTKVEGKMELKPIMLMGASDKADEWMLNKIWQDNNWIAEKKYDGSRYQILIENNEIRVFSRRINVDRTGNCQHIINEIKQLNLPSGTILDGEIIHPINFNNTVSVMNSDPYRSVELQKKIGFVEMHIFDIPIYNGIPNRAILSERKKLLEKHFSNKQFKYILQVKAVKENKQAYYEEIVNNGGEGVILKNLNSVYAIGIDEAIKNGAWFKVKKLHSYDCVVIGGVEGQGKYAGILGALVIGQFKNGKLAEIGTVSGMSDKLRRNWWQKIQDNKERIITMNGKKHIHLKQDAYWIIEIEAQEKAINSYRFPRFIRERTDKKLQECIW